MTFSSLYKHTVRPSLMAMTIALAAAPVAMAQDSAEDKGLAIAEEADRRDTGFGDTKANLVMTLTSAHGDMATRSLRVRTLEQTDDGDKSLIIFDSPGDVRGTAFLSFTHKLEPDDQWLYLPSLKRVKRISQANQSGPFVGSEFAYEDMSSQEVEKYTYKYLGDESFDGRDHFMVEADPVNLKSGYSRQVIWIDQEHYRVWKTDFYDRKGEPLKTLTISEYNQYLDQYWRADLQVMENHQTGKSTELRFSEFSFRNGFEDQDFNRNALQKAR